MRLYPRNLSVTHVDDARGRFEPAEDGGFDLPEDLAAYLRTVAVRGVKQWESSPERQRRLMREEAERRKDPATLLSAVEQILAQSRQPAEQSARKPSRRSSKPAETDPADETSDTDQASE